MFILDFDSTLFHTALLKKDLKKLFGEYGVSEDDYTASEDIAVHGYEGENYNYTVELHVKILEDKGYKIPCQEVIAKVHKLFDENDYAYEDTIYFLEELKKKNERMILLTAGNEVFQMQKIRSIKIEKYLDEIICVRGEKEKYVESIYTPHEKIFFINVACRNFYINCTKCLSGIIAFSSF